MFFDLIKKDLHWLRQIYNVHLVTYSLKLGWIENELRMYYVDYVIMHILIKLSYKIYLFF